MDFGLLKFTTSRGKPAFSLNGFCYRQDKRASDGRVFWRCLEDGCSARMVSDGFDDTPVARGCRVGHHTGIKSNWIESCVVFLARMWAARTLFRADVGSVHIISREGRLRVGFYVRNYRCGNTQRGAIFRAVHQCGKDNVRTRKSALQQCGVGHADSAVNRQTYPALGRKGLIV